jgi:hypothetical protein
MATTTTPAFCTLPEHGSSGTRETKTAADGLNTTHRHAINRHSPRPPAIAYTLATAP